MGSLTFCGMWSKFCRGPICRGGSKQICWTHHTLPPSGFDPFPFTFSSSPPPPPLLWPTTAFESIYPPPFSLELSGIQVSFLLRFQFTFLFPFVFCFSSAEFFFWLCLSRKVSTMFRGKVGVWICWGEYFLSFFLSFGDYALVGSQILSDLTFFRSNSLCTFFPFFRWNRMEWNGIDLFSLILFFLHFPRLSCQYSCFDQNFSCFSNALPFSFHYWLLVIWISDGFIKILLVLSCTIFKKNWLVSCICNFGSFLI